MSSHSNQGESSIPPEAPVNMKYLIRALLKYGASDLHLKVGRPPLFRVNGKLIPSKMPEVSLENMEEVVRGILTEKQFEELETKKQIDLSIQMKDLGRYRCNFYFQKGTLSAAIRQIPLTASRLEDLGVPCEVIKELCQRPRGLFLIAGPSGSGKSTTLAGIIRFLNESFNLHVLSIEDPMEFVHKDLKSSITQREVGLDTPSFRDGIISGLRQDPDVIVIGEMRDYETIQAALTAAETGHLVISTLHANGCKNTIERILDVFQPETKNQVRVQLASSLLGVVAQQLLSRTDGKGQVPVCEVMVKSPVIEDYILNNNIAGINDAISNSQDYYKMQGLNEALKDLVVNQSVSVEEALKASNNPEDLKLLFSGFDKGYNRSFDPTE